MESGFWLLELILRSFPIVQSFPAMMVLSNTFPEWRNEMAVLYGISVAPGILMLMSTAKATKTGVSIYAAILGFLAICFCPPDGSYTGKVLIWSRHLGCIGVYFVFAGRQSCNKSLMTVGGKLGILVSLSMSVVLLLYTETRLGGKYICFIITALFVCWRINIRPDSLAREIIKSFMCCIMIASSFIPVDKDILVDGPYRNRYTRYNNCYSVRDCAKIETHLRAEERLDWTVLSVFVCNLNILLGFFSLVKQEILAFIQSFYQMR